MNRFMSGSQFGAKAGLRVGIFLALTLGFPFIVYGLVLATNARSAAPPVRSPSLPAFI